MEPLQELYQELILDHSRHPHNYQVMKDATRVTRGHNPLCGDQMTLYLDLEGDTIRRITFQGSGCAISRASTSLMTTILAGKTRSQARRIFDRFQHMIKTGEYNPAELGKLAVLAGVHKFPARVKCALLAWHTLVKSLESESSHKVYSTE